MGEFDDDMMLGLKPDQHLAENHLRSLLWDKTPDSRKYNKTVTINVTSEMFEAVQNLIADKRLPYGGSLSTFGRDALAVRIDSLRSFLDRDTQTIFSSLLQQQRRLTRERLVMEIDELISQQAESLRFWSDMGKWKAVAKGLAAFAMEIEEYEQAEWREHAIRKLLQHPEIKLLLRRWENTMAEEDEGSWSMVRAVWDRWNHAVA